MRYFALLALFTFSSALILVGCGLDKTVKAPQDAGFDPTDGGLIVPADPAPPAAPPGTPPTTPPGDPNVVEFRIPMGTGRNPWNTLAAPVNVKRGQTLKIINEDVTPHELHTGGNPCNHGNAPVNQGFAYNCVIKTTSPLGIITGVYDHIVSVTAPATTDAKFYINVLAQ